MRVVIPGLAEAVAKEQTLRDGAFFDLGETVGGIDLAPLSIRRLLFLEACGDPFIGGGKVTPGDVARFLWICSPGFSADKKARDKFIKTTAEISGAKAVAEIRDYIERAFFDAPTGGGSTGNVSTTSFAATLVDWFALEYGWGEAEILDLPLRRAFQYLRRIQRRRNPDAPVFNPLSDRVKGEFLRTLNQSN